MLGLRPQFPWCSRRGLPSEGIQFLIESMLIIATPEPHPKQFDPRDTVFHTHLFNKVIDLTLQRSGHDDKVALNVDAIVEDERTGDQVILILK